MTISHNSFGFDQFNSSEKLRKHPILRFFSPETNRGVISILALVTLLLAIVGGVYLKLSPSQNEPSFRLPHAPSLPAPTLQTIQTDAIGAVTISAGLLDDFFVFTEDELLYYHLFDSPQGGAQVNKRYTVHLDEKPTASCFITSPESPFYEKIFVAFTDSVALFDPETMRFSPHIEFGSESIITGLATDGYDLYAADAGLGIFYRIDREMNIFSWGLADEKTGFEGFSKNEYLFFDLDVAPKSETIYVTHPDKFRVEAFSALDGHWKEDESFEKKPRENTNRTETFSGIANPASITILGDGSVLTTDAGPEPDVKSWHSDGSFQAEISLPEVNAPIEANQAPLATITITKTRAVRLLVLLPSGILASFTASP